MAEDRGALLAWYRESRAAMAAALEGLPNARMTERTLDGWSVKEHLAHVVLWDEVRASEVERISAGHESAWRMTEPQVGTYNALGHDLRKDLTLAQVFWELEHSRERLLRAIGEASARGLDGSLYGEAGLKSDHEIEHAGWIRAWRERRGY